MLDAEFLTSFKRATEDNWSRALLDPDVAGFQFQRGTRWRPGLTKEEITDYEKTLGCHFPKDLQTFLQSMNGTDLPTINIYAGTERPRESLGVYSYPRDLEFIRWRMENAGRNRKEVSADLAKQGFGLPPEAGLVPFYEHWYVVCTADPESSVVLSIVVDSVDAIVYGNSLEEYLEKEFLFRSR